MQSRKSSSHFSVYQINANCYSVYLEQSGIQVAQLMVYPGLSTLQAADMLADIVEVYERYGKALRS